VIRKRPASLWRLSTTTNEIDEILVLREHDNGRFAGALEDLSVLCVPQIEVANVRRLDREPTTDPRTQPRRNLRIDPQDHAATR
jgi:hypothetical protein